MTTLPMAVAAHASAKPGRAALVCGGHSVSYAELAARSAALAGAIVAAGARAGDRVCLSVDDKVGFVVAMLAAMATGALVVPIDVRDAEGQAWLLADSGAKLLLHDPGKTPAAGGVPLLATDAAGEVLAPVGAQADGAAAILYTSGTQNLRKGVVLSHRNLLASAAYMNGFMGIDDSLVEYVSSPLDHAFGFGRIRAVLLAGGTAVMDNGTFNAARVLASLKAQGCNGFSGVAASVAVLIEHGGDGLDALAGSLRWMEIGSQSLLSSHRERLRALFPEAVLVQNFGMTEAVRCTMLDFASDLAHLGSCGRPSPGTEVRIVDEDGAPVAAGTPGIIEVAGPQVALTYWGRDELWQARLHGRWFQSDDFGFLDSDGYLHYVSRRDDLINIAGEKVSPLELEAALRPLMGGRDFAVCAMPDPDRLRGEVPAVCLAAAARDGFDWPVVRKGLAGKVANKHWPKAVFVLPELPRTAIGKVQRRRLRAAIEAGEATPC